jgi:XTP/dITP diphosphohydrolase
VARDGTVLETAEGTVEGRIVTTPRGRGGFGYDPLFYLPTLQRTMAEISDEARWEQNHRGKAFRALLQLIT